MDLKRAWRNGFLVSLLLAVPCWDLSLAENANLIESRISGNSSNSQSKKCDTGTGCINVPDGASANNAAANGDGSLIAEDSLIRKLLESDRSESGGIRELGLEYSPQDTFQSVERTGDEFPDTSDDILQFAQTGSGSAAPMSFGAVVPTYSATDSIGPFALALVSTSESPGSGGFQNNAESATPIETTNPIDNPNDNSGSDDGSLHTVPEIPSIVLMMIGAISVALIQQRRKSKIPTASF